MSVSLLPNGEQQFCDAAGVPYALGTVTLYVPSTTTPKNSWSDPDGHVLNTNPISLDAAGRCVIWGEGYYRQILKDADGNTIWDKVTLAGGGGGGGSTTPIATKTSDYTLTADDGTILVDATTGALAMTLPGANTVEGQIFTIKKIDATSNLVSILGTIDGASAGSVLIFQNQAITVQSNGTAYFVI